MFTEKKYSLKKNTINFVAPDLVRQWGAHGRACAPYPPPSPSPKLSHNKIEKQYSQTPSTTTNTTTIILKLLLLLF